MLAFIKKIESILFIINYNKINNKRFRYTAASILAVFILFSMLNPENRKNVYDYYSIAQKLTFQLGIIFSIALRLFIRSYFLGMFFKFHNSQISLKERFFASSFGFWPLIILEAATFFELCNTLDLRTYIISQYICIYITMTCLHSAFKISYSKLILNTSSAWAAEIITFYVLRPIWL